MPGFGHGRDPVRTPMPWDDSAYAGFSHTEPWLPLHSNAETRNVSHQRDDATSLLLLTRELIALRKRALALAAAGYGIVESRGDVLIYERLWADERLTIALNLSGVTVFTPVAIGVVILSTTGERTREPITNLLCLRPHEGVIVDTSAPPS